nr:uncharacterized protein LOC112911891 [Vulpes vulpes]
MPVGGPQRPSRLSSRGPKLDLVLENGMIKVKGKKRGLLLAHAQASVLCAHHPPTHFRFRGGRFLGVAVGLRSAGRRGLVGGARPRGCGGSKPGRRGAGLRRRPRPRPVGGRSARGAVAETPGREEEEEGAPRHRAAGPPAPGPALLGAPPARAARGPCRVGQAPGRLRVLGGNVKKRPLGLRTQRRPPQATGREAAGAMSREHSRSLLENHVVRNRGLLPTAPSQKRVLQPRKPSNKTRPQPDGHHLGALSQN